MGWFQRGQRDPNDGASHRNAGRMRDSETGASATDPADVFLPGALADQALLAEGGIVLLGGAGVGESSGPGAATVAVAGRRLLVEAPDMLPKDAQEHNRLDFQHHLLRSFLGGNYAAPLEQPLNILDVGAGTGRWALELAALFPRSRVVALDLVEPPLFTQESPPANCRFVQGNVLAGLPFADASFDYVHLRQFFLAIPASQWGFVARELTRITSASGSWVELLEGDLPRGGGPALETLNQWALAVGVRRGINVHAGAQVGNLLRQAGLSDVAAREASMPVGRHGGRLGQMAAANMTAFYESLRPLVTAEGIALPQDYDSALQAARLELDGGACVAPYYLAIGQHLW